MRQKVVITGISGMIGKALGRLLISEGFDVVGLSRQPERVNFLTNPGVNLIRWNGSCPDSWFKAAEGATAIINLAGENIADGRWTEGRKQKILKSRLHAIHSVQDAITLMTEKPKLFIQASATGFYGLNASDPVDEDGDAGDGFLAGVCREIEQETTHTEQTRVVVARFGVVLDKHAGALPKMIAPMRSGLCGYPGRGRNYVPWIHIHDLIHALLFIIRQKEPSSVYNLTAPQPETMRRLVEKASSFKRTLPCIPIPPFFLSFLYGRQLVTETLLGSQHVIPASLLADGYKFRFETLQSALNDIFSD
jgi:uncharacterized protein